jgi:hypothetical protein
VIAVQLRHRLSDEGGRQPQAARTDGSVD